MTSVRGEDSSDGYCLGLGICICKGNVLLVLVLWTIGGFLISANIGNLESASPLLKLGIIMLPAVTGVFALALFTKQCFSKCQKRLNSDDANDEFAEIFMNDSSESLFYIINGNGDFLRKRSLPPAYEPPPSYNEATAQVSRKSSFTAVSIL